MFPLTTHLLAFATPASPERVWTALTATGPGASFLPGVSIVSEWVAGSTLVLTAGATAAVYGEVIAADEPRRLSYALDGGRGPATHITWEIRPHTTGSIVHVYVDEFDSDGPAEIEDAWLPILANFQAALLVSCGTPDS